MSMAIVNETRGVREGGDGEIAAAAPEGEGALSPGGRRRRGQLG